MVAKGLEVEGEEWMDKQNDKISEFCSDTVCHRIREPAPIDQQ
jgi:hypothetical protein